MTSKHFNTTPLHQQLRDTLVAAIADGAYQVGSLLPNEVELARSYGVSAGTARKALDAMEADFMLERTQGRGTFVRARRPARHCPWCKGTGRRKRRRAARKWTNGHGQ
jgi:GntR family transcriptional regulator